MEDEGNPYEQARILEAAKHATTHDPTNPTWRHRLKDGKIESKVFPAAGIPEGWKETAAECTEEAPKNKGGRPRKVIDGDSA